MLGNLTAARDRDKMESFQIPYDMNNNTLNEENFSLLILLDFFVSLAT